MYNKIFEKYNINLTKIQLDLFEKFLILFQEKNSQINLSSIRDINWIIEKHFIDSIILNKFISLKWKVLDLWSGWWFPGIPLKITNLEIEIILLDSIWKKVNCLNYFIKQLWLSWIQAIQDRAEELAKKDDFKNKFDFIISRSVAYMPKILEWSEPFLKNNWKIILYKIFNQDEFDESKKNLLKYKLIIEDIKKYKILDQERVLLICKKSK